MAFGGCLEPQIRLNLLARLVEEQELNRWFGTIPHMVSVCIRRQHFDGERTKGDGPFGSSKTA